MARTCCSNWEVSAPSIVQWPLLCTRGANLVDQRAVGGGEEFDRQHADVAEVAHDRLGDASRLARVGGDQLAAGNDRPAQDSALVDIARRIEAARGAIGVARDDQRKFQFEFDRRFGHRRLPADRLERLSRRAGGAGPGLALAVIAQAAGLEHQRQAQRLLRGRGVLERIDSAPRRHPGTGVGEELLLHRSVLRDLQAARARNQLGADRGERLDRDILELVGDDVASAGERG